MFRREPTSPSSFSSVPCDAAPNTARQGATDAAPRGYASLVNYAGAGGRAISTHHTYAGVRAPDTECSHTANCTSETKYFSGTNRYPMDANINRTFQNG